MNATDQPAQVELASDMIEYQQIGEAPTDHAAQIVALADSARISDIELVD